MIESKISSDLENTRPSRPEVKAVVQVTATLEGNEPTVAYQKAIGQILTWLKQDQGISAVPDSAWEGRGFEIDLSEGKPILVEATGNLWGLRYDNPQVGGQGRVWRTEAIVGKNPEVAQLGVRLSVITPASGQPYYKSVPKVISWLAREPGLLDYGFRLEAKPWEIERPADVERLIRLLECPNRTRPVYVSSKVVGSQHLIDISRLASRVAGLAHVVAIDEEAAWKLSDVLGRRLSIFGSALRTYNPGFDRYSASFDQHPLATEDWIDLRFASRTTLMEVLVQKAIDRSIGHSDLEDQLPSFTRFRRLVAEKRLRDAKEEAGNDAELVPLYQEENSRLREDLHAAEQLADELNQTIVQQDLQLTASQTEVYGLKQRLRHLEDALEKSGKEETVEFPNSLKEVDDWVAKYLSGSLVLLPRAVRGAKKSEFEDVGLAYRSLLLLGNEYRRNRLGKLAQSGVDNACQKLGVDVSKTGNQTTLMQWREQYEVEWQGERRFLELHLKKGVNHDPRSCLRIYFFWDADRELIVVGSMTQHLTSTRS